MKSAPLLLSAALWLAPALASAQTPFTYQGKLENGGAAFTGTVHLRLGLYSVASGSSPLKQEVVPNVSVMGGIFTATPATFAAADFPGAARWLQIEVSSDAGGTYTPLLPRQQVTYSPYALHAAQSDSATTVTGGVAAAQLTGSINPGLLGGGSIGQTLNFNPASGAPFIVGGTTKVTNLNSDLLDGLDSTAFLRTAGGTLTGTLSIASPAMLDFGSTTRQMISLWGGTQYGIGVQAATLYQRTNSDFSWFKGGVHSDVQYNPGTGGVENMRLSGIGELSLLGSSAGLSLKNRDDATNRWVAYSAGATTDSFRIWSADTGDRLTLNQNGDLSVTGKTSAAGVSAASADPNGYVISGIHFSTSGTGAGIYGATGSASGYAVLGLGADGGYGGKFVSNGSNGYAVYGVSDTGWAGRFDGKLYASGATTFANEVTAQGANGGFAVRNRNNSAKRWVMYSRNSGTTDQLAFYSDTTGDVAALSPNGDMYLVGALSTTVLTIRGGADVAEPFQMAHEEKLEEGSVVVIDPASPGKLKLSSRAYDRCVAGVISGAGGVQPGLRLQQDGVLEGGQHVALTGRVYVKADASEGAIQPGDLLTTSDHPGHAMKVGDHASAQGAVLGKAMTPLEQGTGLVLVLVTLQ